MSPTIGELFATPDHYLFMLEGEEALFLPVDREVYRRSLFLDDRIALEAAEILPVSAPALEAHHKKAHRSAQKIGWIFHIAHCGSTLLARALDHEERTLVLREPQPLRQLGVVAAGLQPGPRPARFLARLRMVVALAGRRYRPKAPVIVKANVPVNMILLDLMALDPTAPGILLHHPLETYLLAVLRSDAHRQWVMRVTTEIAPAIAAWAGPITKLDVTERAAALWLAQMRIYEAALSRHPTLRSLSATTLFDEPRAVLEAALFLFDAVMTPAEIDTIVMGPLFANHAKRPGQRFDNQARREREAHVAQAIRSDLDRASHWVDERRMSYPIPDRLARPLVGEGTTLLTAAHGTVRYHLVP